MCESSAGVAARERADGVARRSDVVLELLGELRADQYRPAAWARFVGRSWRLSRRTAQEHPQLVRSWRRTAIGLTLAEATLLAAGALMDGGKGLSVARRAAPGTALCLAYTLADAYVHLGMNGDAPGTPPYETLGLPTVLTLTRCAVAGVLCGHLLGGVPARPVATRLALAVAGITDVTDGCIARRMNHATRLGGYLDSEADFGIGIAVTLTLGARRSLPAWLAGGMLARWLAPFAYALACYFGRGRRVPIGSTLLGKAAGVAQTATLGIALLPERMAERMPGLRCALQVITAVLLVAAPLSQFARTWGKSCTP